MAPPPCTWNVQIRKFALDLSVRRVGTCSSTTPICVRFARGEDPRACGTPPTYVDDDPPAPPHQMRLRCLLSALFARLLHCERGVPGRRGQNCRRSGGNPLPREQAI